MRRALHLLWTLALTTLAMAPAADATSVTVQISGTWDSVFDNANVLGGTVTAGTGFTATLVYDDSTLDTNPSASTGGYDVPASSSDLTIMTSTFVFSPGASSLLGITIEDDNGFDEDALFLFIDGYTASGLPTGISLGGTRYANPTFTDTSGSAHSSDDLTDLAWSTGAYDITSFFFTAGVVGAGAGKLITLQGTVSSFTVLPEPSLAWLLVLGCVAAVGLSTRVRKPSQ
jgi:hypothetical protein